MSARKAAEAQRVLAANVYVGEVLHLAGSKPSDEVAEQITNPKAWASTDEADESE